MTFNHSMGIRMKALASVLVLAVLFLSCSDSSHPAAPPDDENEPPPPPPTFPDVQGITDEMALAEASFPAIADMIDLTSRYGTPPTHQGRNLYAVKISDNVGLEEDEPAFLMVAAHHGNEIGTPVVALDALDRLTQGYGTDPAITQLVNEYEIWIAPVWNPDGYPETRKNGRAGSGVDLNRNYPFLWDSECSGSTNPGSGSYKGPGPASEPETQTMMAFSQDQRFTKVLDLHSSGRETIFGYRCSPHQLIGYLEDEASALAHASSYGGRTRQPSAEGEHYHWQLGTFSNYAFLTEISDSQSPSYTDAVAEAARLWPGTVWMLQRPIPVWGHISDAATGSPLEAGISYMEEPFTQGETNSSEPLFGRYHAFLPVGTYTLRFTHPDYLPQEIPVTVTGEGVQVDVALIREAGLRGDNRP